MSDDFYKRRSDWLDRVANDAGLPHAAFRVAYIIAGYFNRETGEAWPSQATLAARLEMTDRAIRGLLKELVDRGHLECASGRGRGNTNAYSMTENRNKASGFNDINPEQNFRLSVCNTAENRKIRVIKPEILGRKTGTEFPTEPNEEPYKEHTTAAPSGNPISPRSGKQVPANDKQDMSPLGQSKSAKLPRPTDADRLFARFWDAYPARTGSIKTECRKKFAAAVRDGADSETIIRQAAAYAGHCIREGNFGDRARFIKQAQAWLNQRAWEADWGGVPEPVAQTEVTAAEWQRAVATFNHTGEWAPRRHGPEPGAPGCRVPAQYLSENLRRGAA